MGKPEKFNDAAIWLKTVLALVTAVLLIFIYCWVDLPTNKLWALGKECIPSALVMLIMVIGAYFLFYKKGLASYQLENSMDADMIAECIVNKLENKEVDMDSSIVTFHETYRDIDWGKLFSESRISIDILVYYYDSWVNTNYERLVAFFKQPNTKMRVFVADPNDPFVLDTVHRLFPEYSREVIKEKVERTGIRISDAAKEAGAASDRFEFYYVPHILSYSAQCIDNRILIQGTFEMYRKHKIDSPAVVIDLTKSEHLTRYWNKELEGLLKVSQRIKL